MKKFLSIFLAITILLSFAFFAIASSDEDSATVSPGEASEIFDDSGASSLQTLTVKVGEMLTTSNLEITFNETGNYTEYSQYSAPKDGYKIIYIDVSAKNIGESDAYISYYDFNCYADDVATDAYYLTDDGISATLSAGRQTTGRAYFEVPVDAESIEIEYETDFWSDKKAVFVVK